jgi:hypothetical protein
LKGAVGVAGQGFSESAATSPGPLTQASGVVAFDTSLAEEPDLQRCFPWPFADGESW